MSGVSEGETHVAAMRLVCQSLEDHEQQGIEIQWDVLQQMLDHMDVILQGIADQRGDDAEEIQILRRERDAAYEQVSTVRDEVAAEIESLRKQLAAAEAAVSLQRTGIERLSTCLAKIRQHVAEMDQQEDLIAVLVDIRSALAELDAGNSSVTLTGSPEAEGGK